MALPDTKSREDSWIKASWLRLLMEAVVFSKILKNKLYMWGCERQAPIFLWGIASKLAQFAGDVGRTCCRAVE